jgi:hypothetical protein
MLQTPKPNALAANPFYCSFVKPLYAKPLSLCITAKCGASTLEATVPAKGGLTELKQAFSKSMDVPTAAIRIIQRGKILDDTATVLSLGPSFRVMLTLAADYKDRVMIKVLLPRNAAASLKRGFKGIELNVCVGETVAAVKQKLHKCYGFPAEADAFYLLLNGNSLEDKMTLLDAKIKKGDTLNAIPRVSSTLKLWLQPSEVQPKAHTNQISLRICKAFSISWPNFVLLQPQQECCETIVKEALKATEQGVIQRDAWAASLIRMLEQPVSNVMATGVQMVMVSVPPERLHQFFFPPPQTRVPISAVENVASACAKIAAPAVPCQCPITQHYAAQDKATKLCRSMAAGVSKPSVEAANKGHVDKENTSTNGNKVAKPKKAKKTKKSSYKSMMKGLLKGVGEDLNRAETKQEEERRSGLGGGAFHKLNRI